MDMPRTNVNDPAGFAESSIRLKVAIVYEDLMTGARAKSALEFLLGSTQLGVDIQLEMWRFDLSRDPAASNQVRDRMAELDIIVLSTHGKGVLPGGVLVWLNEWFKTQRTSPGALVVSLDEPASDDLPARQMLTCLQSGAASAGVQVFQHSGSSQMSRAGELTSADLNQQSELRTPLRDETLNRVEGHSHWGINE
jgi:hypothetical protein